VFLCSRHNYWQNEQLLDSQQQVQDLATNNTKRLSSMTKHFTSILQLKPIILIFYDVSIIQKKYQQDAAL